jgi:hypothetical protein
VLTLPTAYPAYKIVLSFASDIEMSTTIRSSCPQVTFMDNMSRVSAANVNEAEVAVVVPTGYVLDQASEPWASRPELMGGVCEALPTQIAIR